MDSRLTPSVTVFRDAFAQLSGTFDYAVIDTPLILVHRSCGNAAGRRPLHRKVR